MQYATQLIQFPVGLLGAAVALAVLPTVSRESSWDRRHDALAAAIRLGLAIMLPATIGLLTLRTPVAALVYERGSFTTRDTVHTASALLGYAPQLPFVGLSQILTLAYFARRNTFVPALVSVLGLGAYMALAALLLPYLTIVGLALANTVSLALQAMVLALLLARRWPRMRWNEMASGLGRVAAAGAIMALTVAATSQAVGSDSSTTVGRAAQVLVPGGLGLAAYLAVILPRLRGPVRSPAL
jgi:putative peptidoglycan lipid II flippase